MLLQKRDKKSFIKGTSINDIRKMLGFLTPSPLVCIWFRYIVINPRNLPNFIFFGLTPPLSPLCRWHISIAPKKSNQAKMTSPYKVWIKVNGRKLAAFKTAYLVSHDRQREEALALDFFDAFTTRSSSSQSQSAAALFLCPCEFD